MTNPNQYIFAYCIDNQDIANEIDKHLGRAGIKLEHIVSQDISPGRGIGQKLLEHNTFTILLVSDNFLKSVECMHEILESFQKLTESKKLIPVVVDGYYRVEDKDEVERVPTVFNRVSHIIKYMNHWQERYLELRKLKRQIKPEEAPLFNQNLEVVRGISSTIGEFLRCLREASYYSYEQFSANDFALFFNFVNEKKEEKEFREPSSLSQTDDKTLVTLIHAASQDIIAENETKTTKNLEAEGNDESLAEKEEKPERATTEDSQMEDEIQDAIPEFNSELPETTEFSKEKNGVNVITGEDMRDVKKENDKVNEVTKEFPESTNNLEILLERTRQLFHEKEIEKGLNILKEAVEQNPANTTLRYHYALSVAKYGRDIEAAANELKTLLTFDPEHEDGWFLHAELAEIGRDYLLAKTYYEKVEALNPNYPDINYRLGILTLNHFEKKYKKAAAYLKNALKRNSKNADIHYRLGLLFNDNFGEHWKAVRHFKKTLKLRPDHPFANYDLAVLFHRLGDRAEAYIHYQKAVEINPELQTTRNDEAFKYVLLENDDDPSIPFIPEGEEDPEFLELKKDMEEMEARMIHLKKPERAFVRQKEKNTPVKLSRFHSEKSNAIIKDSDLNTQNQADNEQIIEKTPKPETEVEKVETEAKPIVLITGATSGIGRATADIFARNGYRVILTGRRQERLKEIKTTFEKRFQAKVKTLSFDIRDLSEVQTAIESLSGEWTQVDILINNAGLAKGYAPIHEGEIEDWETMIDTNIKGLLYITRAITPHMVKRKQGHVINVASTSGKEVYPNGNVYCATKFAVDGLTKAIRYDLFKHNIRVSQVSPAHVESEFSLVRFDGDEEKANMYEDFQPLKPEDVADAIYYIATRPPYVNIQDIVMWGIQQASPMFIDKSGRKFD